VALEDIGWLDDMVIDADENEVFRAHVELPPAGRSATT
jgi:hypothetical protein